MSVLMTVGSAASALVVILFVYLAYLTGGVDLDRQSFLRGVFMIRCPQCKSEGIRRSKRRGFVERGPLTLAFLRPFRCKHCEHRFFRWPTSFNKHSDTPISPKELVTARVR
jgi:predicted Zn-ribbon and HTH transcriptional regulator